MSFKFFMPQITLMGENCLLDLKEEIQLLNFKKALIVTDRTLVKIKLIDKLTNVLKNSNIQYIVYEETKPNPTISNVEDGLYVLENNSCDFIISFGGGSVHDAAKGIAILATNKGNIKDYEGLNKSMKPQFPLITVNTTAGTAAEMTMFSIITDEKRKVKMAIVDKHLTPLIAVNDPILMLDMPKDLTASTGMDALTHAIEAYVSKNATPITDACALMAIEIISKYLKIAVENGQDKVARDKMAYAEYLAGMAFNNASLGYVHAMAHQLGGLYDLPHGVCNAILLPHVQKYNSFYVPKRLKEIAKAMGIDTKDITNEEGAEMAIEFIKKLSKEIDIPSNLKELGVKEEDLEILSLNALKDVCGFTNPQKATKEEILSIFKEAM